MKRLLILIFSTATLWSSAQKAPGYQEYIVSPSYKKVQAQVALLIPKDTIVGVNDSAFVHIAQKGGKTWIFDSAYYHSKFWKMFVGLTADELVYLQDSTLSNVYQRNDSVFIYRGGQEVFVFKITAPINGATDVDTSGIADGDMLVWDSTQSKWVAAVPSAGGDSTIYSTHTYVDSVINTLNVLIDNAGTGENILFDRNDTIYGKRITGDGVVSVTTDTDSSIHVGVDLSSYTTRTEVQDSTAAIRADMGTGTGSGLVYSGVYGPGGTSIQWWDTTIHRLAIKDTTNNVIYHIPITDSVDATNYDADAQAYIDAVNATDVTLTTTQKQAINTYVVDSKAHGTWTKTYDVVLPVWGTSASSAIMLKQTHTVTWVNTPTFSSNGVVGNGTSQYGNLNFSPANAWASQDAAAYGIYVQTNVTSSTQIDIGAVSTTPTRVSYINSKYNASSLFHVNDNTNSFGAVASSAGFVLLNRSTSTGIDMYKNGSLVGSASSTSTGLGTNNFFMLAYNSAGSPSSYSTRQISAVIVFNTNVTSTEAGYAASDLNTLMTSLGINVY